MEFYDYDTIEIQQRYDNISLDMKELETRYKHIWNVRNRFVCMELNHKNYMKNLKNRKQSIEIRKEELCECIKDMLAKIMVNKFMNHMLEKNKIKLSSKDIKKNINLNSKDLRIAERLNKISGKECKALVKLNKEVISLYRKKNTKYSDYKITLDKKKNEEQNIKLYNQLEKKDTMLNNILIKIVKLDEKIIITKDIPNKFVKNMMKETKYSESKISILKSRVKNADINYETNLKRLDNKFKHHYEKNGFQCCAICLEENCRFIKLNCGHYYHVECISAHIQTAISSYRNIEIRCPTCRTFI